MRRKARIALLLLLPVLVPVGGCWLVTNPLLLDPAPAPAPKAVPARLESDVRYLAGIDPARSSRQRAALDQAADFIADGFSAAGCAPDTRVFRVDHVEYRNVICAFGPEDAARLVIGAHYDVAGEANPGADDNASGVAALLELARMISAARPSLGHRLELVAFSLEEPPHFRSESMGSYVHAQDIVAAAAEFRLMVSVEMIGYFSDEPGSQSYPAGILESLYPDRADFIGVVGALFDRSAVARVKGLMSVSEELPVHSINAPAIVAGIDFSDHWSFWQNGLPAVMVTDTAFLRNPNYHEPTDTPDTLDYRRMALVVDGLYQVAVHY